MSFRTFTWTGPSRWLERIAVLSGAYLLTTNEHESTQKLRLAAKKHSGNFKLTEYLQDNLCRDHDIGCPGLGRPDFARSCGRHKGMKASRWRTLSPYR